MTYPSVNKNNFRKISTLKVLFLTLTILFINNTSWAQHYTNREGDTINNKFYISAGTYYPTITTTFRVDSQLGLGTEIGLEDDLKLSEDLGVFRIDGLIQLTENSQLSASYMAINRDKRVVLEKDIQFGDSLFTVNSSIKAKFDVSYLAATYRYNFFNEQNWTAGLSAGLRGVFINSSLEGQLNAQSFKRGKKFNAPALLFGVHGSGYLTPRLLARYSLEFFYLNINDVKINVLESNASVHYFIFKNIGLGISYSTNSYRLTDLPLSNDFKGKVNFNFNGLNMYLTSRF